MKKMDFNSDWRVRTIGGDEEFKSITLPHDAMISESRNANNPGAHNTGYFEGNDYLYVKHFSLPKEWKGKKLVLEFEGVYRNACVFLNDKKIAERAYGYTNFYVDISDAFFDKENEIKVIAKNYDQPNSRWYSGAGIYRPVWLYCSDEDRILLNGVKLKTLSIHPAVVQLEVKTSDKGEYSFEIFSPKGKKVYTGKGECNKKTEFTLEKARLWSERHPAMYECRVTYKNDEERVAFGIRTVSWDRSNGLRVNNRRVLLRGACIHSDNQLLGAISVKEAEFRRVKLLKKYGYNAIRSAHNPCSKYLLEACDREGVYVMDEYVDMWYTHKTKYDYASEVKKEYKKDLKDMVDKDFNHPSVIMYSTGNEVSETAEKKGIELTGTFTDYLHSLDDTRMVTCGINIFFNFLSSVGFGVYSDEKAEEGTDDHTGSGSDAVGSEFFNKLTERVGDIPMKAGAMFYGCDLKTKKAFENMDVAGYNYGIFRYKHDLKKYKNRLIVGSETFCKDAYMFYEIARKNPGVIGDFVWTGMDYLGECGIGAWEYEDYAPKNADKAGWISAGAGRLDLAGNPLGEAYYTLVAFNRTRGPIITARPVYQTGGHSPSAWKMTDTLRSWSYEGCEGYEASIEVYARAKTVELFLNGRRIGRKKIGSNCVFKFKTKYEEGELLAIAYNKRGEEIGRDTLVSAGQETILAAKSEEETWEKGVLQYIDISYEDSKGIAKPTERHRVSVATENAELIALASACPYNPDGFLGESTDTYYGRALAIVRPLESGKVKITISDEDGRKTVVEENIA